MLIKKKHSCRPIHGTQHAPWIFDCIFVPIKWVDFENCHGWLTRWYAKSSWEGRVCDRRLLFCLSLLIFWIALKPWGGWSFYCYPRHSLPGSVWRCIYICMKTSRGFVRKATTTTTTMGLGLVATAPVVTVGPQSEARQFFGRAPKTQLSNEQRAPGWWDDTGDYTTPLYLELLITHYKDLSPIYNHGSGNLLCLKGNYYWRHPTFWRADDHPLGRIVTIGPSKRMPRLTWHLWTSTRVMPECLWPLDLLRVMFYFVAWYSQWLFLVPLIGGRWYIITQLAIYKWYISGIYCQLGDYISPTTY